MEELLITAIKFHIYFLIGMVIAALINLYFIFTSKEFSKKVKKVNPAYYGLFASVAFTGVIILAVYHLHMTHTVYMMIVAWLVIFVMSMKLFKKYKYGTPAEYREFAKKKYILDIALISIVTIIVYAV